MSLISLQSCDSLPKMHCQSSVHTSLLKLFSLIFKSVKMSLEDRDLLYLLYVKKHVPRRFTHKKWKKLAYW